MAKKKFVPFWLKKGKEETLDETMPKKGETKKAFKKAVKGTAPVAKRKKSGKKKGK